MNRRSVLVVLPLLVAALVAAGCGGDDNGSATTEETSATGETLQLAADSSGALAFDQTTLAAPAGTVTIELTNDSSVPHNVEVEGNGVEATSDTVTGETTSVTVDLEPGTYDFYCAVPGHREAGMEGTLTAS